MLAYPGVFMFEWRRPWYQPGGGRGWICPQDYLGLFKTTENAWRFVSDAIWAQRI